MKLTDNEINAIAMLLQAYPKEWLADASNSDLIAYALTYNIEEPNAFAIKCNRLGIGHNATVKMFSYPLIT